MELETQSRCRCAPRRLWMTLSGLFWPTGGSRVIVARKLVDREKG